MKTLLIALLTLTAALMTAQKPVEWIGGTPGKETAWDEPRNWSDQRVPDEFSDVHISDVSTTSFSYPVIKSGEVEVNSLYLASTARLNIEKEARLVIHGFSEGLHRENLKVEGSLVCIEETKYSTTFASH